ncbi:hypothetical protein [Paenibacillus hexagrammi]|uniref:Uncharacterized protein n=1 Tax=Paenibacillus hexagrammi TaxID=2908839 RepID=A0ABY3SPV5_9BACL|nr:hypothetical protein [Paenibacillus sp. YPD9-1]UJF35007.1 hypothetical protein L0M14_07670 [Paenibacillus sp. YPD9-1]
MLKDRYYSTVEYTDRFGANNREFLIYCPKGQKPTIGDFLEAFQEAGYDMEIKDYVTMTFKPKDTTTTNLISLRIIRTIRDYSYTPLIKNG